MFGETRRQTALFWTLAGLAAACTLASLYWAFFQAGVEVQLGYGQKIFYWHVPSAIAMETLFFVCAGASLVYLVRGSAVADRLALAAAEVGVMMSMFVLISGPLWARTFWGHYWEWEPRLTLSMVVFFMYVGYLALRAYGGDDSLSKRISAGLGVAGAPAVFLARQAVALWRGTHPQVVWKGGLQDPDMKIAFWLGVSGFAFLAAALVWQRYRLERARNEVESLTLECLERDLIEEES